MAINLNKGDNKLLYYYSDNGLTSGPFTLDDLLSKIKSETLVYREGIEWTNAKNVPELKKYFLEEENKNEKLKTEPLKTTNYWSYILFLMVLLFGVFYFKYNKKNSSVSSTDTTTIPNNIVDSVAPTATGETIDQGMDTKQGEELQLSKIDASGEYFSNGISYGKDKIIDNNKETWWTPNPTNGDNSYLILNLENGESEVSALSIINGSYGRYYMDNSRITKLRVSFSDGFSEEVQLSETQEYQNVQFEQVHKSKYVKVEPLERIRGNKWDDICISELRVYGNSVSMEETNSENVEACDQNSIIGLLNNMFEAFEIGLFNANDYFSPNITQYINLHNTNPDELNRVYEKTSDFKNVKNFIQHETLQIVTTNSGCKVNFISKFTCYRPSKYKWQRCLVDVELVFNDGKISSYVEKRVSGLQFSDNEFD
jgi:hypothetical protein